MGVTEQDFALILVENLLHFALKDEVIGDPFPRARCLGLPGGSGFGGSISGRDQELLVE